MYFAWNMVSCCICFFFFFCFIFRLIMAYVDISFPSIWKFSSNLIINFQLNLHSDQWLGFGLLKFIEINFMAQHWAKYWKWWTSVGKDRSAVVNCSIPYVILSSWSLLISLFKVCFWRFVLYACFLATERSTFKSLTTLVHFLHFLLVSSNFAFYMF